MNDPDILETILLASEKLNKSGITYLHLCEADWDDAPAIPNDFRKKLRTLFNQTIIATGNKTPEEGHALLTEDLVDLIGFGRNFISNPDYPERVKTKAKLNAISDNHTSFGGGSAKGYKGYPFLDK
jgi:N-ethylmaleimide reductase